VSSTSGAVEYREGVGAALHKEFIPNWTSKEFADSVDQLADIVDSWRDQPSADPSEWKECYRRVLELEAKFWPEL
jgi:thiaminase